MTTIQPYMKAVVAVLGALVTALVAVLPVVMESFPEHQGVQTWGPIVSAFLTAVAVYVVPNKDPLARHQDESTQPPGA